ncbi:MAG: hypothetical protein A2Y97_10180 [Nitrospirae bacterium RBG_13_39_12]|nr:MAG: hypothetical protein A2Y97_10180 [Nitrospirae bacterium RBG_13_39_12]
MKKPLTIPTLVLNSGTAFPLTLYNVTKENGRAFLRLLQEGINNGRSPHSLADAIHPFLSTTNIHCQEIDDYINTFKPIYLKKVNELVTSCEEWGAATEKTRRHLLRACRTEAIRSLDVQPDCNLDVLFDTEPEDKRHINEVINLIAFTYMKTVDNDINLKSYQKVAYLIDYLEIGTSANGPCPYCTRMASNRYSLQEVPKFPFHIGCRCVLDFIPRKD